MMVVFNCFTICKNDKIEVLIKTRNAYLLINIPLLMYSIFWGYDEYMMFIILGILSSLWILNLCSNHDKILK
jgi:hypothetical protein